MEEKAQASAARLKDLLSEAATAEAELSTARGEFSAAQEDRFRIDSEKSVWKRNWKQPNAIYRN